MKNYKMSENEKSLEDFFAKKSKKKGSKGKGKKFTTSDEIAKKLVEQDPASGPSSAGSVSSEVTVKKSKSAPPTAAEGSKAEEKEPEEDLNYRFKDDDEWTDFRDESQKDYSGLKIQALQIQDEQPEGDVEEEEVDENGEVIKGRGQGASGPWNKSAEGGPGPAAPAAAAAPASEPEPPKEEPKPAAGPPSKYVPPGKRGGSDGGSGPSAAAMRPGRKGKAPQINSEFEFPTLAASSDLVKHSNKVEDATFSTVTRGGQALDSAASKGGDLQLGNRFAALGN